MAATMYGSSETTFYVLAVYFGSVGVTNFRYALAVGLLGELAGAPSIPGTIDPSPEVQDVIEGMGITTPTPIQRLAIQPVLDEGRNAGEHGDDDPNP